MTTSTLQKTLNSREEVNGHNKKEYSFKIWLVGLNPAFFTGYIGESWFGMRKRQQSCSGNNFTSFCPPVTSYVDDLINKNKDGLWRRGTCEFKIDKPLDMNCEWC